MTVAWDGLSLAADSQVSNGDTRVGEAVKIGGRKGVGWGACGALCDINAWMEWCERGMPGDPPAFVKDSSTAIIVRGDTVLIWDEGRWDRLTADRYAIGSGRAFALGAMEHGASAKRAVEAAIRRDVYSGGRVRVLRTG